MIVEVVGPCAAAAAQDVFTPGAGDRRSRRSSSIGGEDDDEDPDSPLPPSKRYRNGCTKTRIACFPLVQVRDAPLPWLTGRRTGASSTGAAALVRGLGMTWTDKTIVVDRIIKRSKLSKC